MKQTEIFGFWFYKTNRNKTETDLVSACFGLNQNLFGLFRGHPTSNFHQLICTQSHILIFEALVSTFRKGGGGGGV
jgi:hypothetical protein